MTEGPGRYDDLCTIVREKANAAAALVIVLGGDRGSGFSMQALDIPASDIADLLESVARQIRGPMLEKS